MLSSISTLVVEIFMSLHFQLYSGFYKHEVEANIVGAEILLYAMGYTAAGGGKLALLAPVCPDTVAAVSRDALVAHCECQVSVARTRLA